jgi:hypothetical protein
LYNKSLHQSYIIFIILRGHISNAAWGTYNFVVGPIEGKKLSNTATVFILNAGMLVTQQHVIQQVDSFDQPHLSTNQQLSTPLERKLLQSNVSSLTPS